MLLQYLINEIHRNGYKYFDRFEYATSEKVSYSQNNILNYNLYLELSHIKLNSSTYSFVPLIDLLISMSFIPLGASTGTQTTLEYKDSNFPFIAPCQTMSTDMLVASS